ncbi:MAG: flagellar biosynthetic protein FliR [Planctomycetota bacterium]
MPFDDSIFPHVTGFALVAFRLAGIMVYGPVFGSSVIPTRIKLLLAWTLALALYPAISSTSGVVHPAMELTLWSLAPIMAFEVLLGICIGFIANVPMLAVQAGGLVMGQQMGLGFARFFNPAVDASADIVGQLLFFLTLAGFLAIGGLEAVITAVLNSFEHVPLAGLSVGESLLALLTGLLTSSFELALRVAAPLLALIFLQSVAMGFIAKTVPQLNILSLGFPLRILAGLTIVMLGLTIIDEVIMEETDAMLALMLDWVEHGAAG